MKYLWSRNIFAKIIWGLWKSWSDPKKKSQKVQFSVGLVQKVEFWGAKKEASFFAQIPVLGVPGSIKVEISTGSERAPIGEVATKSCRGVD